MSTLYSCFIGMQSRAYLYKNSGVQSANGQWKKKCGASWGLSRIERKAQSKGCPPLLEGRRGNTPTMWVIRGQHHNILEGTKTSVMDPRTYPTWCATLMLTRRLRKAARFLRHWPWGIRMGFAWPISLSVLRPLLRFRNNNHNRFLLFNRLGYLYMLERGLNS